MADWRHKLRTITRTDGSTAPEPVKQAALGCLSLVLFAVSILTFIILFSLFRNGHWLLGIPASLFFLASAGTAAIMFPLKRNSL
ncbi:hypothetical protein [Indiicoccus explosivorum]|uniref:hypothetical protein n=1 Tax=Indiicoccus explosivorum TaxID=1917864 RepID=UPI000B4429AD|nr:hypothetical protein [Indiicoccus explosivorum]